MQPHKNAPGLLDRRLVLKTTLIGLAAASMPSAWAMAPKALNDRLKGDLTPIHDPCVIRDGDTVYVYCTTMDGKKGAQIPIHTSKDMVTWKSAGFALPAIPAWALKMIPKARGIWAPDLSYAGGRYHLYYAVSSFGSNQSVVGLATNATMDSSSPKYKWQDHGPVFMSKPGDAYNCIDPAHIVTSKGEQWLAFGSFWSGLKLIRIDPKTGKQSAADKKVYAIAARPTPDGGLDTIEAAFLIERNGYFYLFASYDYCCKGINSTYYTCMGRSKSVTGPYLDRNGRSMMDGYGSVILKGDQEEQQQWRGPGHCAILRDPGQDYIFYHAYNKPKNSFRMNDAEKRQNKVGSPYLRVAPLIWSKDGWPTAVV